MPDEPQTPDAGEAGDSAKHGKKGGNIVAQKVGPLPLWAWVAVGAAALFLYKHFRKGSASNTAAVTSTNSALTPEQTALMSMADAEQAILDQLQQRQAQEQAGTTPPATPPAPNQGPTAGLTPGGGDPHGIASQGTATPLGSVFLKPDSGWAQGLGEYFLITPDLYGQGQGPAGHGAHGAGADEVAAYINKLYPTAKLTPDQLAQWNGGQRWYTTGQQLYVGSLKQGVGH